MSIDTVVGPNQVVTNFSPDKLAEQARQIAQARRRVLRHQSRLNSALPYRRGDGPRFGDPDAVDADITPRPMLIVEFNRGEKTWQFKVGSVVWTTPSRINISTTDAVPLTACPSDVLLRFGLGDEIGEVVDYEISEARARTKATKRSGAKTAFRRGQKLGAAS